MKKILSIIIAVAFIMTAGVGTAFADNGKKNAGKAGGKAGFNIKGNKDKDDYKSLLKNLKDKYEAERNNARKQEQLLKDIAKLKKKYGDQTISIYVNGKEITTVDSPVIKKDKLLLPLNALTKGLKAQYSYDEKTGIIVITKGDIKITLTIGSNIAIVNNTRLNLEHKVELDKKHGVIIPLGLLAKLLNGKVTYDSDSGTVVGTEGVVTINDNITGTGIEQFNYTGTWSYGTQDGAYGKDNHWSSTTGSSLQIRFTGTKIKLYGAKAPNHGIAYISIDGTTAAAIDYYSDTRKDNALIFESTNLGADKEHVLTVIVSGLKNTSSSGIAITADRVEVTRFNTGNLALNKPVTASSIFADGATTYAAINAVDGKADTRWSSAFSDQEWLSVDLGNVYDVSRVKLKWEAAFGKSYIIQLSADGINWVNVSAVTNGDGGIDELLFTSAKARYVRMLGVQRATSYGYSLYEFEIFTK